MSEDSNGTKREITDNIVDNKTNTIEVQSFVENVELISHSWKPLKMFLCTYRGKLSGLNQKFDEGLMQKLEPTFPIVAINSNFGHKCLSGYENYLKSKENKKKKKKDIGKKERKHQGDGTCFAHAVVFNIKLNDKIYNVRCFTASGDTQIPGVVCTDYSDGKQVMKIIAAFLNDSKIFKDNIEQIDEKFTMRNYNFGLTEEIPGLYFKYKDVIKPYFDLVESVKTEITNEKKNKLSSIKTPAQEIKASIEITKYGKYIDPGKLIVKQVKYSNDDNKFSITFELRDVKDNVNSKMLLKVFSKGKMNILGVKPVGGGQELYNYIIDVFDTNWKYFVGIKPKPTKKS